MTETVHTAIAARLDALGIPARIDTTSYPSIVALFEEALATYRTEAACTSVGHTLSYADLDRLSAQFAGWLQHSAGLEQGDRVAIQMPNLIQYLVVCLGALRAGMVVVNTNPPTPSGSSSISSRMPVFASWWCRRTWHRLLRPCCPVQGLKKWS